MRVMTSILPSALLCVTALSLSAPAAAQPLAWSQQQVVQTAADLERALKALLADPELNSQQATAMQQREHTAAVSSVRHMLGRIDTLNRKLAAGYTRDESLPFWDQVAELRGDVQAYARHSWLPPATAERAQRAGDLLDTMARLYTIEE